MPIYVLLIEDESDFCSLGGRLAFVPLLLDECAERLRARPARLVDDAVDDGAPALGEMTDVQLGYRCVLRRNRCTASEQTDDQRGRKEAKHPGASVSAAAA
jgi:hypothetical protein